MTETPRCRSCDTELTISLVDLGSTPLANSYVDPAQASRPDPAYPLHVRVCPHCFLAQVEDAVPPDAIFSDYAYFSSYSSSWVAHAKAYCESATKRFGLTQDSFVVEVASNDGYLLQHFVAAGVPVLGVEPAANVAAVARKAGVPTEIAFFGKATAEALVATHGKADLTAANNVLAHVPDINDFVAGFAAILKPKGVASFEFPHLLRLMNECQFDTVYHEHFSYLSLLAVERIFAGQGLRVFDVEELPTHGGSLRVWACLADAPYDEQPGLVHVRRLEAAAHLDRRATYDGFQPKVERIRSELIAFLDWAKGRGATVAAYGAAAKGNTLLNFCGVTVDKVAFVVDANPHKQGRLLPGSRIPILPPDALKERKPDYVLILPWNLTAEITQGASYIRAWGGRFLRAIPKLEIME